MSDTIKCKICGLDSQMTDKYIKGPIICSKCYLDLLKEQDNRNKMEKSGNDRIEK